MSKILLAEDDDSMRQWLCKALSAANHEVVDCANGHDALLQLHKTPDFDLLLTDIVMPRVDGIELSKKATALYPSIKIMFITGFSGMNVGIQDKSSHTHVMAKPFHLKDLVAQVEQLLKE